MARQYKINQVYNDGILAFKIKEIEKDKYNTPLREVNKLLRKEWYRKLGITSNELYQAMQVDTVVHLRVGIRLYHQLDNLIDSNLRVEINNKTYSIVRVYHNVAKKETELSLMEVIKNAKSKR